MTEDVPWALVLAGGDGVRLRELTRRIAASPIPKQYCRLIGDRSPLEMTLSRIGPIVPASRTLVVVNHAHLALARPQLADVPKHNLVIQPANRDTGPGVLLGLVHLCRRDARAVAVLLPSDHYVHDEDAFRRYVGRAMDVVRAHPHRLALLGIPPDRPEPGYGYVTTRPIDGVTCSSTFGVEAFEEKPSAEAAARFVGDGALWNSLVMVFRVDRMLECSSTSSRTPWSACARRPASRSRDPIVAFRPGTFRGTSSRTRRDTFWSSAPMASAGTTSGRRKQSTARWPSSAETSRGAPTGDGRRRRRRLRLGRRAIGSSLEHATNCGSRPRDFP